LLGDGAAALGHLEGAQIAVQGAQHADPVQAPVLIEASILHRDEGLDEMLRDLLEGDIDPLLLEEGIAALAVHLRTRKEMSAAPAHWEVASDIVRLRDQYAPGTLIIGNGDVSSLDEAHARVAETGIDGVMIGRGAFGNPWFFSGRIPDLRERLLRCIAHTQTFETLYKSNTEERLKNFDVMKKHFKAYVAGFDGAKELRMRLMEAGDAMEVKKIVEEYIKKYLP